MPFFVRKENNAGRRISGPEDVFFSPKETRLIYLFKNSAPTCSGPQPFTDSDRPSVTLNSLYEVQSDLLPMWVLSLKH